MARRRTLRPEEAALWQAVARSTAPLHPRERPPEDPASSPVADLPPALVPSAPARKSDPIPAFRLGERAPLRAGAPCTAAPPRMDAKAFGRMTRGKLAPEARIDLHGMTLAEAHPELIRFVLAAQAQGMRLVLVITGKGRGGSDDGPMPRRAGVLRHQVPHWLRQPPLAGAVLQVAEAHPRHGGSGACYVYLRRGG